jgi:hypothetical protein
VIWWLSHLSLLETLIYKRRRRIFHWGIWRVDWSWILLDYPLHRESSIVFIQIEVVESLLCKECSKYVGKLDKRITLLRIHCHVLNLPEYLKYLNKINGQAKNII